jgi:hypothetical protein
MVRPRSELATSDATGFEQVDGPPQTLELHRTDPDERHPANRGHLHDRLAHQNLSSRGAIGDPRGEVYRSPDDLGSVSRICFNVSRLSATPALTLEPANGARSFEATDVGSSSTELVSLVAPSIASSR